MFRKVARVLVSKYIPEFMGFMLDKESMDARNQI